MKLVAYSKFDLQIIFKTRFFSNPQALAKCSNFKLKGVENLRKY